MNLSIWRGWPKFGGVAETGFDIRSRRRNRSQTNVAKNKQLRFDVAGCSTSCAVRSNTQVLGSC